MADGVRAGQLASLDDGGEDGALRSGNERREDGEQDGDEIEGCIATGLDDEGDANGRAGDVAKGDDEAAGDGIGGNARGNARNHRGDDQGEHEQAGVEGLTRGIKDEEDEGEVEGVLGDAREEARVAQPAEWDLLEEGRGRGRRIDLVPGGEGAHEAVETRDRARCSKRRRSSITRRPHSRQARPISAPIR